MKVVLIGAGSASFGRGQVADILQAAEFRGRGVELALVDENPEALERMAHVAQRMAKHTGSDVRIESVGDRCKALQGADYVIMAVARRRYELWEQDFRVPLAYGFKHCLGENGGPGALFHALRSIHLVLPICRDVETICPEALLLNFTNPEARVLHAITHLARVKAVGICHGVFSAIEKISEYLRRPAEELEIISAGMNHLYCVLSVRDRATGEEFKPQLVAMAANDPSERVSPLFKRFARIFDVFTFPSEDHIGEYVAYGSEFHGTKWDYGIEKRAVRLQDAPPLDRLAAYAGGDLPADDPAVLAPSGESTVPIICDVELDRGALRPAVNVLNSEGWIENLPRDAVVEVPARVDADGVHPLRVGAIPEAFAAILRTHFSIHACVTEAYRTKSRKLLLQALLLDPCVDSVTRAEKMLDDMLALQREFLPAFS